MKLLRYLEEVKLYKSENEKQSNGSVVKTFTFLENYQCQVKTLDDEINATIYGANINKMLNISSPLKDLEKLLMTKVDNKEDNISLYFLEVENKKYKITSVKKDSVTIERL